jgi:hypothetical protein
METYTILLLSVIGGMSYEIPNLPYKVCTDFASRVSDDFAVRVEGNYSMGSGTSPYWMVVCTNDDKQIKLFKKTFYIGEAQ